MDRETLIKKYVEAGIDKEKAEKLADDALSLHKESVNGLKSKNEELLSKMKGLKEDVEKYKDIDPEKYRESMKKLSELEKKNLVDKGQYEEAIKVERKAFEDKIAELSAELEKKTTTVNDMVIQNQLVDNLVKAGVKKDVMDVLKDSLISKTKVVDLEGKPTAVIDDVPVNKYLESWTKTDVAKHFLGAPDNKGGGAGNPGGDKTGNYAEMHKKAVEAGNTAEAVRIKQEAFDNEGLVLN